jgi:hypothetical protein
MPRLEIPAVVRKTKQVEPKEPPKKVELALKKADPFIRKFKP